MANNRNNGYFLENSNGVKDEHSTLKSKIKPTKLHDRSDEGCV